MWLAQVPALPSDANVAYQQWIDDGNGTLKPGQAFNTVDQGINNTMADMFQTSMASPGNPMQPQSNMGNVVSPKDQQLMQKIGYGAYPGQAQVMADVMKLQIEVNSLESQWDQDINALVPQKDAQMSALPVCPGEAGLPSGQEAEKLELQFADKRISIASKYLAQIVPLAGSVRAAVLPQIDYGDDAFAAWAQISNPGLKQQVSTSARGAEQQSLSAVGIVEQLVEGVSSKAAQAVADKKAIQRKYADAGGCGG
jgi:hypothetical protein